MGRPFWDTQQVLTDFKTRITREEGTARIQSFLNESSFSQSLQDVLHKAALEESLEAAYSMLERWLKQQQHLRKGLPSARILNFLKPLLRENSSDRGSMNPPQPSRGEPFASQPQPRSPLPATPRSLSQRAAVGSPSPGHSSVHRSPSEARRAITRSSTHNRRPLLKHSPEPNSAPSSQSASSRSKFSSKQTSDRATSTQDPVGTQRPQASSSTSSASAAPLQTTSKWTSLRSTPSSDTSSPTDQRSHPKEAQVQESRAASEKPVKSRPQEPKSQATPSVGLSEAPSMPSVEPSPPRAARKPTSSPLNRVPQLREPEALLSPHISQPPPHLVPKDPFAKPIEEQSIEEILGEDLALSPEVEDQQSGRRRSNLQVWLKAQARQFKVTHIVFFAILLSITLLAGLGYNPFASQTPKGTVVDAKIYSSILPITKAYRNKRVVSLVVEEKWRQSVEEQEVEKRMLRLRSLLNKQKFTKARVFNENGELLFTLHLQATF